jgi:hypothetical protein
VGLERSNHPNRRAAGKRQQDVLCWQVSLSEPENGRPSPDPVEAPCSGDSIEPQLDRGCKLSNLRSRDDERGADEEHVARMQNEREDALTAELFDHIAAQDTRWLSGAGADLHLYAIDEADAPDVRHKRMGVKQLELASE